MALRRTSVLLSALLAAPLCARAAGIAVIGRPGAAAPAGVAAPGPSRGAASLPLGRGGLPSLPASVLPSAASPEAPSLTGVLPEALSPAGASPEAAAAALAAPVEFQGAQVQAEAPAGTIFQRTSRDLGLKRGFAAVYDGSRPSAAAETPVDPVSAPASQEPAQAPSPAPAESPESSDRAISRRVRRVIKDLRGGYLGKSAVSRLKEELRSIREALLAAREEQPGYRRAAALLKRAAGEVRRRRINNAVETLDLALDDVAHKTSWRAAVRIRRKRDSRSRAEVSYRYYVDGTRMATLLKRLSAEGDFSHARIDGGEWLAYDLLPLDLPLRDDLVLDLVRARRPAGALP